jgi:hypothetical protein
MNKLNYASLEASKRLQDAGILLDTDYYWTDLDRQKSTKGGKSYPPNWKLISKRIFTENLHIPAPSMAEVWRELPWQLVISGCDCMLGIFQPRADLTYAVYDWHGEWLMHTRNTNHIHAMIDLLIWARKDAMKKAVASCPICDKRFERNYIHMKDAAINIIWIDLREHIFENHFNVETEECSTE